ncbi:NAD(P)H-hydrate dehydratase [Novosphingobium sp. ZN18A2]|uniref:NAD(P)H-hydrate dehydratase n=1 Tax=Novosphingobium sp. ZN18A2 TaxID=3079861 RepID=UPI0030CE56C0
MPQHLDPRLGQVLTVAQMREAEEALIAAGTSVDELMQRAGHGAGEWVRRVAAGRKVTVLCGPGNNGGDGYVIAQHLFAHGNSVEVVAAIEPKSDAARTARSLYKGPIVPAEPLPHGEVLVDCLFGSGLARALSDDLLALLASLSASHTHRIAIDLPSGIESDSGKPLNEGLPRWDMTVALGAWKFAHWTMPACETMGALHLVDIGVGATGGAARVLAKPQIASPAPDAHKYTRGLLAIVGGDMPGATLLSADAALRAGAGYVKLVASRRPASVPHELVVTEAPDPGAVWDSLRDRRIAAMLVGPGLGTGADARERLRAVLDLAPPAVADADALKLLSPDLLAERQGALVLTPHEGEMAALEGSFGLAGQGARRDRALALAKASDAVVLLKGPDSLIAAPDGTVVMAPRAPSWLSVAGSGDVLAGAIASRLAVHGDALRAAEEGLWLHAAAARHCGAAFTAGDLASAIAPSLECALA